MNLSNTATELLQTHAHHQALAEQARAMADRFRPAVIARVVADHEARADAARDALSQHLDALEVLEATLRGVLDEAEAEARAAESASQELALRTLIGEQPEGDAREAEATLAQARAAREQAATELAAVQALVHRVVALLPLEVDELEEVFDDTAPELPAVAPAPAHPVLIVWEGTDEEVVFPMQGPELSVGRRRDNDIALPADSRVSRYHCRLWIEHGRCFVRDLDSANGTLVNGELIAGERQLFGGEELIIGSTFLRFTTQ